MGNHREEWTKAINQMAITRSAKRSKYGAVKTTVDGIVFDSKKEAQRYHELRLREKAGEIRGLQLQPEFSLNTWHGDHSEAPKVGVYRGDFKYDEKQPDGDGNGWLPIVEDVKGFKTPLYRWKKKHVEAQYGIQIKEI